MGNLVDIYFKSFSARNVNTTCCAETRVQIKHTAVAIKGWCTFNTIHRSRSFFSAFYQLLNMFLVLTLDARDCFKTTSGFAACWFYRKQPSSLPSVSHRFDRLPFSLYGLVILFRQTLLRLYNEVLIRRRPFNVFWTSIVHTIGFIDVYMIKRFAMGKK